MPYIALCHDSDACDAQALRKAELQPHLDYVATLGPQLLLGGPLQVGGAGHYNASLFVYDVNSASEARTLLENDPYFQAGLYADVMLAEFTPARGCWLAGAIDN